jgi:hypothetical protein
MVVKLIFGTEVDIFLGDLLYPAKLKLTLTLLLFLGSGSLYLNLIVFYIFLL